jgi:uncharacterized protein
MKPAQNLKRWARYANTGYGPVFSLLEVGLEDQVAVIEPEHAFWALVAREALEDALSGDLVRQFQESAAGFQEEMENLRFGLKPTAVYLNPTDRCNFNCSYCYLPEDMRRDGKTMTAEELAGVLGTLREHFHKTLPSETRPQIIFHGSEPLLARETVFAGIERFHEDFVFGIQTNASLLDEEAIAFLTGHQVGIGISLDGPDAKTANGARKNWQGSGFFNQATRVLEQLASYPALNVITTVTSLNVHALPEMVDFLSDHGVRVAMFNPVRCTQAGGLSLKPEKTP